MWIQRRAPELLLALACALAAACMSEDPVDPLTVAFVDRRVDALNGQTISVAGYLGECFGYECDLYASKADHDAFKRWFAVAIAAKKTVPAPELPSLGIGSGSDDQFDAMAAPFTNSYVVITGQVTNVCRFNGERACTDRGLDIQPTAIRAGNPPAAPKS